VLHEVLQVLQEFVTDGRTEGQMTSYRNTKNFSYTFHRLNVAQTQREQWSK